VYGSDWPDNIYSDSETSIFGSNGGGYCYFGNLTVDALSENPQVCVNEAIESSMSWATEYNTAPVCYALGGNGCYYNEWDLDVAQYDCALNKYVTDTYTVSAYYFCCNDGVFCNNHTIEWDNMTTYGYVEYVTDANDTVREECKKSSTLKDYYSTYYGCIYGSKSGDYDSDTIDAWECNSGTLRNEPNNLCNTIKDIWSLETNCDCTMIQWFDQFDGVNDSMIEYMDDEFDSGYDNLRDNLEYWDDALECNSPSSTWQCVSGAAELLVKYAAVVMALCMFAM
jgi:hypothetical protein